MQSLTRLVSKVSERVIQFIEEEMQMSPSGGKRLEYVRQLCREKAKNDLWFFGKYGCGFADIDTPLHHDMATKWQLRRWALFSLWQVPRGHLKTSLWTEAGTLWEQINGDWRFLVVNADKEKAQDIASNIRIIVETQEIFRWLFPEMCWDLVPREQARRCKVHTDRLDFPNSKYAGRKEGNIECMGVEASLVSKHYDLHIYDDPVNDKNTTTRQYRNKIDSWYLNSLQLRHDPSHSRVRLIGTDWHADDQYQRIRRMEKKFREEEKLKGRKVKPKYFLYLRKVVEPAADGKGQEIAGYKNVLPIWPERFSPAVIEDLRKQLGSYIFSCQYMNDPLPSESAVFKHKDIQILPFFDIPDEVVNFMSVDIAVSDKDESDYSAITVASFDSEGKMYVRQIVREKLMPKKCVDIIWELCQRWQVRAVAIETIAFQQTLFSYYKEQCALNGWAIPWVEMKRSMSSKSARFLALQPRVERGDFAIEEGISNLEELVDEMTTFSLDHLPPYDDILDTIADLEKVFFHAAKPEPPPIPVDTYEGYYGSLDYQEEQDEEVADRGVGYLSEALY